MLPGKALTPEDIVKTLLRRRWLILLPLAIGLAITPVIATRIPQVYRSETLILVIPQRVPDSYVKSTVTATVGDRLPAISEQILSRSRLERIINDFDLYKDLRSRAPMEDVVRRMRDDVGPVSIREGEQSFRVGYTSEEPGTARKVAGRLASLFIDENSRDRESLAESTNVFLESQLEDTTQRLVEHERKLEVYRRAHAGELPSQLESNLQAIQTAQLQLQSQSESMNRARERRLLIERQLVDAQTIPTAVQAILPTNTADTSGLLMSSAQRLEVAQNNLRVLKLRYKPDHPDVRGLERTIRELQAKADDEAQHPPDQSGPKLISVEEQGRQKKIRDLQAELDVIDHQLSVGQAEEARLKASIGDYRQKVEAVPTRESELVELTRDYEILKKTYDSLLTKKEDSKLAANLERRQIGEQFRILDPASLPEKPANQFKRLVISFAGAGVGLILGLALAALLEFRNTSFARGEDIERFLALPVLAMVPAMISEREQRRSRIQRVWIDVAATVVVVGSAAVVVVWGLAQR